MRRMLLITAALLAVVSTLQAAEFVPAQANKYKRDLIRVSQLHWGLDAPVARFAAQVHQESTWQTDAQSIYAKGLAQFTPATAVWITKHYNIRDTPYSPRWSLNALVLYDRHLYDNITESLSDCDHWAFTLSAYNGGPAWVPRDRLLTSENNNDPNRWFNAVEQYTRRSKQAKKENRHYVRRILYELESLYITEGWQGEAVCG